MFIWANYARTTHLNPTADRYAHAFAGSLYKIR